MPEEFFLEIFMKENEIKNENFNQYLSKINNYQKDICNEVLVVKKDNEIETIILRYMEGYMNVNLMHVISNISKYFEEYKYIQYIPILETRFANIIVSKISHI